MEANDRILYNLFDGDIRKREDIIILMMDYLLIMKDIILILKYYLMKIK